MQSPTAAPVAKVTAVGVAGAVVAIVFFVGNYFFHIEVPATVVNAVTLIVAVLAGYFTPPSPSDVPVAK